MDALVEQGLCSLRRTWALFISNPYDGGGVNVIAQIAIRVIAVVVCKKVAKKIIKEALIVIIKEIL